LKAATIAACWRPERRDPTALHPEGAGNAERRRMPLQGMLKLRIEGLAGSGNAGISDRVHVLIMNAIFAPAKRLISFDEERRA